MNTPSAEDLPDEVIEQILWFVPSPRAVCRFASTCSRFSELIVHGNERLWDQLYKKRWRQKSVMMMKDEPVVTFSRRDYIYRHAHDRETLCRLVELTTAVAAREQDNYGLGWPLQNQLFFLMSKDTYSFDILRSVAKNDGLAKSLYNPNVSTLARCLATQLVDIIYFNRVMQETSLLMKTLDQTLLVRFKVVKLKSWRSSVCAELVDLARTPIIRGGPR